MAAYDFGSYPHELAGGDAPPPSNPSPRILDMARESARRAAPTITEEVPLYGAGEWRMAAALVVLADEANHANPRRDKSSDGTIGDARHQALGSKSDHNPWVTHKGVGVCRARDLDASGLNLAAAFERARVKAYRGELPQLVGGGYLIHAGKITAPDFSGWRHYTGNPHVLLGHVSVSLSPARFDLREPWGIFSADPKPTKRPPAKPPASKPAGRPASTRWLEAGDGHYPAADPRHAATRALQGRLRTRFPAYARHLAVDGRFGPATAAAVREYQRRKGLEASGIAGPLTLSRLGL